MSTHRESSSSDFGLSDNDEEQLIRNIGYGYASGFLYSTGKQLTTHTPARNVGQENKRGMGGNQPRMVKSMNVRVNPLTDKRRDMGTQPDLPEWQRNKRSVRRRKIICAIRTVACPPIISFR